MLLNFIFAFSLINQRNANLRSTNPHLFAFHILGLQYCLHPWCHVGATQDDCDWWNGDTRRDKYWWRTCYQTYDNTINVLTFIWFFCLWKPNLQIFINKLMRVFDLACGAMWFNCVVKFQIYLKGNFQKFVIIRCFFMIIGIFFCK